MPAKLSSRDASEYLQSMSHTRDAGLDFSSLCSIWMLPTKKPWKFYVCFWNRSAVISASSRTSSTSVSTRQLSSFKFVVRDAFPYEMQLISIVKGSQFHSLAAQVQAEQRQQFACFLTLKSYRAVSNTINCSGEKIWVLASDFKKRQVELLGSSSDMTTLTQKDGM